MNFAFAISESAWQDERIDLETRNVSMLLFVFATACIIKQRREQKKLTLSLSLNVENDSAFPFLLLYNKPKLNPSKPVSF